MEDDALTSHVRPPTNAVITIRVIRSFPYRNSRNLVLSGVDLQNTTPSQLQSRVRETIASDGAWRPFRSVQLDSLKVYSHAHGTKSMNLIINFENDDDPKWLLLAPHLENSAEPTLWECGVENETELSVFKWDDYCEFKKNPTELW